MRIIRISAALSLSVDSSTSIAKLKSTSSSHMISSCRFFNPKLTAGSLFELRSLNIFKECSILRWISIQLTVVGSCNSFVPFDSAEDTVNFITKSAYEFLVFSISIPLKHKSSVWSWTVQKHFVVFLHKQFELELDKFII